MHHKLMNPLPASTIAILAFLGLLCWRLWSDEAKKKTEISAPVHAHTVTFTCTRTCEDLTTMPPIGPW
jgi:predicted negative regulator of RcsB-dependent stress response